MRRRQWRKGGHDAVGGQGGRSHRDQVAQQRPKRRLDPPQRTDFDLYEPLRRRLLGVLGQRRCTSLSVGTPFCVCSDKTGHWLKIDAAGLYSTGTWPNERGYWALGQMSAANSSWLFRLPSSLASGHWLLRTELIALSVCALSRGTLSRAPGSSLSARNSSLNASTCALLPLRRRRQQRQRTTSSSASPAPSVPKTLG